MKIILFAYVVISATALTRYDFSNQSISKKTSYYRCVKHAKENCNVLNQYYADSLLKTCKLLVIHNHNIFQIKNSKHCIRKVK